MTKEEAISFVKEVDRAIEGWADRAEAFVTFAQERDSEAVFSDNDWRYLVEVWKGLRDCTYGCAAFLEEQDGIEQ